MGLTRRATQRVTVQARGIKIPKRFDVVERIQASQHARD